MSHQTDPVRTAIARLSWGRRRVRFASVLTAVAFWGCVVGAAIAVLRLPVIGWEPSGAVGWGWLLGPPLLALLAIVVLALVSALAAAAGMRVDPVAVAKRYDDRVAVKDLVSSSLQLGGEAGTFATAVRENAVAAVGQAAATPAELYPVRARWEFRWLPAPLAVAVLVLAIPIMSFRGPPPPDPAVTQFIQAQLAALEAFAPDIPDGIDPAVLDEMRSTLDRLGDPDIDKRKALAEIARLEAELEKAREELERKKLTAQKAATKMTSGEDYADLKRDMQSGRFREAANKVAKKLEKLKKELEEALKKGDKLQIEKLRRQVKEMQKVLAELEELQALGQQLDFFAETLDMLENFEGALGELGEFDGMEIELAFDKLRRPQQGEPQDNMQRLVDPSNEAGEGHSSNLLGEASRALTEREDAEVKGLRESKGKSQFGQAQVANDRSRSRQEYEKAYLAAKREAEDAIYRQNIPVGYRRYIRRYFENMQPDQKKKSGEGR